MVKTKNKIEREGFFSFTGKKLAWAFALLILTFVLSVIFMGSPYTIANWVLNPITMIVYMIFYGQGAGPEFIFPLIPLLLALVWDYIVICVVYYLVKKIRSKN
jgi:hypothetical protein